MRREQKPRRPRPRPTRTRSCSRRGSATTSTLMMQHLRHACDVFDTSFTNAVNIISSALCLDNISYAGVNSNDFICATIEEQDINKDGLGYIKEEDVQSNLDLSYKHARAEAEEAKEMSRMEETLQRRALLLRLQWQRLQWPRD